MQERRNSIADALEIRLFFTLTHRVDPLQEAGNNDNGLRATCMVHHICMEIENNNRIQRRWNNKRTAGNQLPLQWRHSECDGVSNHQRLDGLLNHLFRRGSKKTPKLRVTGICEGNSPMTVTSPTKGQWRGKCFHLMTSSWLNGKLQTHLILLNIFAIICLLIVAHFPHTIISPILWFSLIAHNANIWSDENSVIINFFNTHFAFFACGLFTTFQSYPRKLCSLLSWTGC